MRTLPILVVLFSLAVVGLDAISNNCLKCICQIESGCNPRQGCGMDVGSLSCGPYQIKKGYWEDCNSLGNGYQQCTTDMTCSENCVMRYMNRYATSKRLGRTPTCQDYARIHNGGPKGYTKSATVGYWNKVSRCCASRGGCWSRYWTSTTECHF